jgi:hypothetical protein
VPANDKLSTRPLHLSIRYSIFGVRYSLFNPSFAFCLPRTKLGYNFGVRLIASKVLSNVEGRSALTLVLSTEAMRCIAEWRNLAPELNKPTDL